MLSSEREVQNFYHAKTRKGIDNWFVTKLTEFEQLDKLYETVDNINIVVSDYRTHRYYQIGNSKVSLDEYDVKDFI
jgi:hypothetical protein